jgi:hypothetical protein
MNLSIPSAGLVDPHQIAPPTERSWTRLPAVGIQANRRSIFRGCLFDEKPQASTIVAAVSRGELQSYIAAAERCFAADRAAEKQSRKAMPKDRRENRGLNVSAFPRGYVSSHKPLKKLKVGDPSRTGMPFEINGLQWITSRRA